MAKLDWKRNIWTGISIMDVTHNGRIMKYDNGPYWAEYWGDYSRQYPQQGPARSTLQQAKKDLTRLSKEV